VITKESGRNGDSVVRQCRKTNFLAFFSINLRPLLSFETLKSFSFLKQPFNYMLFKEEAYCDLFNKKTIALIPVKYF